MRGKVKYDQEFVVARKGRRGFFKTREIDYHTTIVDCRVDIKRTLLEAMMILTGFKGLQRRPVRLITEGYHGKKQIVNQQKTTFKFVASGVWELDVELSRLYQTPVYIFKGVLVGNKNERYSVRCDSLGITQVIHEMKRQAVGHIPNQLVQNKPIQETPVFDAKLIPLVPRRNHDRKPQLAAVAAF